MIILGLDIETIPNQNIPKECMPQFDTDSVKLGNLKDKAKIDAKIEDARILFEKSIVKTMSLDPVYAQLCTSCVIVYDTQDGIIDESIVQVGGGDNSDHDAVKSAWKYISAAYQQANPIVTFNGKAFDIPVLMFRAMEHGIQATPRMCRSLTHRYHDISHYDLLQELCGWDRTKWHGLDFFLKRFGIERSAGMDGSKVWGAYQAGEYAKIAEYCREDTLKTCELFARIEPWIVGRGDA